MSTTTETTCIVYEPHCSWNCEAVKCKRAAHHVTTRGDVPYCDEHNPCRCAKCKQARASAPRSEVT